VKAQAEDARFLNELFNDNISEDTNLQENVRQNQLRDLRT